MPLVPIPASWPLTRAPSVYDHDWTLAQWDVLVHLRARYAATKGDTWAPAELGRLRFWRWMREQGRLES